MSQHFSTLQKYLQKETVNKYDLSQNNSSRSHVHMHNQMDKCIPIKILTKFKSRLSLPHCSCIQDLQMSHQNLLTWNSTYLHMVPSRKFRKVRQLPCKATHNLHYCKVPTLLCTFIILQITSSLTTWISHQDTTFYWPCAGMNLALRCKCTHHMNLSQRYNIVLTAWTWH